MKNISFSFSKVTGLILAIVTTTTFSFGQSEEKKVSGEVLDMACYMAKGAHGDGHKDCASACIKGGSPMGILTSDGKVILVVENHDKKSAYEEVKKHAGEQITLTGTLSEKGGVPGIIVSEVKAKS